MSFSKEKNDIILFDNKNEIKNNNNDIIEQSPLSKKVKRFLRKKNIYSSKRLNIDNKIINSKNIKITNDFNLVTMKNDKKLRLSLNIENKEQFLEFYINDNIKNSIYNLEDNTISTTKYNIFTFLPKGLLYQFSRWANIYFLFTAIIQNIPIISPIKSITAIIPLIFVLGISMIREAFEDIARYKYDHLNNEEEIIVLRNNKFIKSKSKTLRHGEIILIYENQNIPTDMILIDTSFSEGICYVETSSLDGEKNLKLKATNKYTLGFINEDIEMNKTIENVIQSDKYFFSGFIRINVPNVNLNYINGTFHPKFKKLDINIDQDIIISNKEFILKGSVLKNTNWIMGVVVYTGMNNKIILNSKKPRIKISKIVRKLNLYLLFVFMLLIFCCVVCSITHHFKFKKFIKFYKTTILIKANSIADSVIIFFTYFLLLNTFIPISLIVTIEIVKMMQGIFIKWDVLLYSKWRQFFCSVKGFSIIEDLGNVNFIFSDKTGTLTKNQLQFKYCIIDKKYYKYLKIGNKFKSKKKYNRKKCLVGTKIFTSFIKIKANESNILNDSSKLMLNKDIIDNNADRINMFLEYQDSSKKITKIEEKNKIYRSKSIFTIDEEEVMNSLNAYSNKNDEAKKNKFYTIIDKNKISFYLNGIIRIGEGYFSNPKNNSFLRRSSNKFNNFNTINYIHEFWIALALANECMIKNENGKIKYIGTSLDDLELVKTAAEQGYRLIETSVNNKTLSINGQKYNYEILQTLGFSSERKRMSIIVKYQNEIILYIKGAESEIRKRLSKITLENENYKIISNGLNEYSKKGLRTLMVAYRKINDQDYNSWAQELLDEDKFNIKNKKKLIDNLYDVIESNLALIGGTVVEDKLQDNVPQTIKELKLAGIKIWILTGDKLDTAKSIGYSCNLLSEQQKIFMLKVLKNDEEMNVENLFKELDNFFKEFQDFIISLDKKYNPDSKYLKVNIIKADGQIKREENNSNNFTSIDFEVFHYLINNKVLEPYSIIIESPILDGLFIDKEMTKTFLNIAYYSNTVICCRISPSQKSKIIKKIKNFDKNAVTLAIGDGRNDVSMITEANIGVGIYGEEGMSAVQASDFAIGEFQLLKRLLFIHGRTNLYRISTMILYFFYKNFILSFSQFYYSTRCLASGQTIIDDWYITCYNLVFTSVPIGVKTLTDSDIDCNDKKHVTKNLPYLYKENRDEKKIFTFKNLILNFLKGIFFSLIFYLSGFDNEILIHGYNKNMSYVSLRIYISIIIVVSLNLLIESYFIVFLLPLSIAITTFLLLIIFLILNHYGLFFNYTSKGSLIVPIISSQFILGIILIGYIDFFFEYSSKLIGLYFNESLSSKLILHEYSINKKRKSLYSLYKNPIDPIIGEDKSKNEKSKNSFISVISYNKLNLVNEK